MFPLGAVPKPLEPTEMRPASDHTKTGLNHASDMSFLKHSLTAHKDVAWLLRTGYFMYVSDVEAAFTVLPLAPWLWWFFLFRVQLPGRGKRTQLCMHLTGDFGTRGMPGCFYIFYAKVVLPMARSELVVLNARARGGCAARSQGSRCERPAARARRAAREPVAVRSLPRAHVAL